MRRLIPYDIPVQVRWSTQAAAKHEPTLAALCDKAVAIPSRASANPSRWSTSDRIPGRAGWRRQLGWQAARQTVPPNTNRPTVAC